MNRLNFCKDPFAGTWHLALLLSLMEQLVQDYGDSNKGKFLFSQLVRPIRYPKCPEIGLKQPKSKTPHKTAPQYKKIAQNWPKTKVDQNSPI